MIPLDRFEEPAGGPNHPEGVTWNPVDGHVYAGGESGELNSITLEGHVVQVGSGGGSRLGILRDDARRRRSEGSDEEGTR